MADVITPLLQDFLDHPNAPRQTVWRYCSACGNWEQVTVSGAHRCPATGECSLCHRCDECWMKENPKVDTVSSLKRECNT